RDARASARSTPASDRIGTSALGPSTGTRCHSTSTAPAAARACSSRSATTPTTSPSRTTATTPGIFRAASSFSERSFAPRPGGRVDRHAELRAGALEQLPARERRGIAQARCLLCDGVASESPEIEGYLRRVAEHDVHAFDRQVELVRDELGERRPDPLSEVDLARERRHGAVALETDALLEPLRILPIPHQYAALFTARMAPPYAPPLPRFPARA